ncbi:MAG: cadmium-translocating P-type ATPase [Chloroflexi bacterium]|nr:cadmium-translocating P-type ATPase [Chloroflexota bacterium]
MAQLKTITLSISGMDCAECTQHVQHAIAALPGVESVDVFLASEKATIKLDPALVELNTIRSAVAGAGYGVPATEVATTNQPFNDFTRRVLTLFGIVFGAVLFVVVVGEWLGLFEQLTERVPFPVGALLVLVSGWPIFVNVVRAALRRQVIAHTLMSLGVLAALAVGQWATAVVVVFFMRVGDYAENFTTERARRAVKDLTALAPQTARVKRDGVEVEILAAQVVVGQTVIVRPGETIPVDGEVIAGQATVDQSAITGESMPAEVGPSSKVFAATLARLGHLRIRTLHVGPDTTFGRVVKLVEEAEAHRATVQRFADKFTAYYLPIVATIAALTLLFRRDPLAAAAVLVVACSCSIALATPIAMLASIGAGAKRGLLIKGGKYLETLARADVLLIDKTGTVTLGKPEVTEIRRFAWRLEIDSNLQTDILQLAASAEKYSEHPLAEAVRVAARKHGLTLSEPQSFEAMPGLGVRAVVDGKTVTVGNKRLVSEGASLPEAAELEAQGKTLLFVACDDQLIGVIAAADTLRSEVPGALADLRKLGVKHVALLTGDNERTASALASKLRVECRANLLPEDKIAIVKDYQAKGHTVVMVGDGVNDAPALAQADVGIAMGAAGTDIAIEAAHITLMRDDWMLVPQVFAIAKKTMGVVKTNLIFTAIYNVAGLSLAAFGLIPPIFAAAMQSLPDLGILANSARLLRQK